LARTPGRLAMKEFGNSDAQPDNNVKTIRNTFRSHFILHPYTIHPIKQHVNYQTKAKQSGFRPDRQQSIDHHYRILMKRMKTDAATTRIVHRVGKQVIQIDQHWRMRWNTALIIKKAAQNLGGI
jgi:hypothetical protein